MSQPIKICLFAAWMLCFIGQLAAQPAGAKPIPTPNGEIWLVDESWFEKSPPSLAFYKFGEKDGLKIESSAELLLQDSRGDIWFRDDGGVALIRYDGHHFKSFFPDTLTASAISDTYIFHMVETPDGSLWFRHKKGVSRYDFRTERFQNFEDTSKGIPSGFFNGRSAETGIFDRQTSVFVMPFPMRIVDANTNATTEKMTVNWVMNRGWMDGKGNIWSIQSTPFGWGLVCVKPQEEVAIRYAMQDMIFDKKRGNPEYDAFVLDWCPDPSGENIWVVGWMGGLRRFNIASKRWMQFSQNYRSTESRIGVNLESTLFITPATEGRFWLGTANGITLFDPRTWKFSAWWHTDSPESLQSAPFDKANALVDREGRLWLSAGFLMIHDPKSHFAQTTKATLPPEMSTYAWYDSKADKCWYIKLMDFDRFKGDLLVFDEHVENFVPSAALTTYDDEIVNHTPHWGLAKTGRSVYFTLGFKLYRLHLPTAKLTEIKIPLPPGIQALQKPILVIDLWIAKDGNIWLTTDIPTQGIPLVRYFPTENRFEYFDSRTYGLSLTAGGKLFVDSKERIWVTGYWEANEGVNCFDLQSKKVLRFTKNAADQHSISSNEVNCLDEDSKGNIWMATDEGICWYDASSGQITQVQSFTEDNDYIAVDHQDKVWVSGKTPGYYDPKTGLSHKLGQRDGIYGNTKFVYVRRNGAVCFGYQYRIFPDKIPVLMEGPVCRFTSLKVFDRDLPTPKAIDFLEKIELSHTDNTFTITWSARNFTNPEQDSFFYQLEGMDEGWLAVGADRLSSSYLKVPPGDYAFRLKCKNRDGVFGPERRLTVRIIPAFYQTIWFKLLIIGALVSIVAVIASLRQRQKRLLAELKQKEAEFRQKEAEFNQRISEYQMTALRAQMNPHFIFNSLNSINRFVQMSGPDAASNYLTKFARLIRLVLDNSRSDMISLDSELEAVKLYLELEALRFAGQFVYHLTQDDHLDAEAVQVPPLFIQPYLENAIWHGLMQKESADKKLEIDLHLENHGLLSIHIRDNGIGRRQAMALRSKSAASQKSYGMDITAERLRMFTERTGKKIDIEIIDLADEQGHPMGTSVKIFLETQ